MINTSNIKKLNLKSLRKTNIFPLKPKDEQLEDLYSCKSIAIKSMSANQLSILCIRNPKESYLDDVKIRAKRIRTRYSIFLGDEA
jgi:hypothetical protein